MRLEAGCFPESHRCKVYEAERMEFLKYVRWADDETHQYCQHIFSEQQFHEQIIQAKRIWFSPDFLLIVINPIADGEAGSVGSRRNAPTEVHRGSGASAYEVLYGVDGSASRIRRPD